MEKELKVRIFDMEIGRCEITLNEEDAKDLGIHSKDRIKLFINSKSVTVVLNITKTIVNAGEIGICSDLANAHKVKPDDRVSITPAEKPRSV